MNRSPWNHPALEPRPVPIPRGAWVKTLGLHASDADELQLRASGGRAEHNRATARPGKVTVRPMRPGDEPLHEAFVARLEAADRRSRFGRDIDDVPAVVSTRRTRVDPARDIAFIATVERDGRDAAIVGEVRAHADPGGDRWEFGIVVASDRKGSGLGRRLLERLVDCARERGVRLVYGLVASSNDAMLALARRLGFAVEVAPGSRVAIVSIDPRPSV
jgi:acetyltransferase